MSKDKYIRCTGFPRELLPAIIQGLDGKMVVWGRSRGCCAAFTTSFTFAGCEWEIDELNEYVEAIKLVSGNIDAEALTAAVLTGKIEVS
jgi:hypothetical protein